MPRSPIHPGKFVLQEIIGLRMTLAKVAKILGMPLAELEKFVRGKSPLTPEIASKLSAWLGTSEEMWLNLQKLYEQRLAAKQERGRDR
jgi:addiction module HigA family antidote